MRLVCAESLSEELRASHRQRLSEVVLDGHTTVRTASPGRFGLFVVDTEVDTTAWIVVFDDGRLHATVRNDSTAARTWAEDCFDTLWTVGRDRTAAVDALADDADPGPHATSARGDEWTASASAVSSVTVDDDREGLLGGGYAVDHNRLRTPGFGTDRACTVVLWFETDGFTTDWETLVKWDHVTLGCRREELFGHVFDPDDERIRARTDVPSERITPGQWHHVGYSYDERTARLYLDGSLVDETEDGHPLEVRPSGACLGYIHRDRDTGVHSPEFDGRIADARFHDDALSPERLRTLYETTEPMDRSHPQGRSHSTTTRSPAETSSAAPAGSSRTSSALARPTPTHGGSRSTRVTSPSTSHTASSANGTNSMCSVRAAAESKGNTRA